ncbi:DUF3054 domain-containing protein [Promicromonospora thailandica]|uniref:DUF3054 family protein n=1 Tax=Promicromonospora thailandica TaxID=765201 RepID=A0A9X2JSV9_9MICO|nr:DUF3054 domain-containing protein [Promicromonospora thailandica]MCP2262920.1 Protein of unknown function (DUF3054) [Promicromonospora thailandica]BFF18271.1 DUF3054 domain-containing protein [Promicromonospora thailandica]
MSTTAPSVRTAPVWPAAAADAVAVLAFTAIGIASHDGNLLSAFGRVVWPFALAAVLGWLVARAWRHPARVWPTGVVVWAVTVLGGLALRGVSGGGLAWSFALVTAAFLALTLLGWRAVATLTRRRRTPRP